MGVRPHFWVSDPTHANHSLPYKLFCFAIHLLLVNSLTRQTDKNLTRPAQPVIKSDILLSGMLGISGVEYCLKTGSAIRRF